MSWGHLSISGISQLLLTQFLPNSKGWFVGYFQQMPTVIVIFVNICPGDICWCKEYLSCYWPKFDFWTQFFASRNLFGSIFFGTKFCLAQTFLDIMKIFWPKIFLNQNVIDTKFFGPYLFWTEIFFGFKIFLDLKFRWAKKILDPNAFLTQHVFGPKIYWIQEFRPQKFWDKNLVLNNHHSQSNNFWAKIFLDLPFFWTQIFWNQIFFYKPNICLDQIPNLLISLT